MPTGQNWLPSLHESEIDERDLQTEGFSGPLQRALILHRYGLEYFPHSGQPEHFCGSEHGGLAPIFWGSQSLLEPFFRILA